MGSAAMAVKLSLVVLTLLIVFWGSLDGRRVRGDGRRFRTDDAIRQTRRRLALQRDPRRGEWTANKGDRRHQGTDNNRKKDLIEENKVRLETIIVNYDITKEATAISRESKTKQHVKKQKNYDHDIAEEGSGNDPGEAKVKKHNPQNNTVFINGRKAVIKKRKRGRKLDNKKEITEQKNDSDDLAGEKSLSFKGRRVRVKKRRRQKIYRKNGKEHEAGVTREVMIKEEDIPKPTLEYQNQNDLIKVYKPGQGQARFNAKNQFLNFPVSYFSSASLRPFVHTNEIPFLPSMEISNKYADESLPQLPFNLGSYKWSHHLADLQYMDFSSFDAQFDPKENLNYG